MDTKQEEEGVAVVLEVAVVAAPSTEHEITPFIAGRTVVVVTAVVHAPANFPATRMPPPFKTRCAVTPTIARPDSWGRKMETI